MNFHNATFKTDVGVPADVLTHMNILAIDVNMLEDAKSDSVMGRHILDYVTDQFEGSMDDWTQVGELCEDQSHFCEIENKMEYMYLDVLLFVRTAEILTVKDNWYRENNKSLKHSPFLMLSRFGF